MRRVGGSQQARSGGEEASAARGPRRVLGALSLLALLGLALHTAAGLGPTAQVRLNDFEAYWGAAQAMQAGHPERLYDPGRKWFTNLPAVAWAVAPLGRLEYPTAWRVFWWIQTACFAASFGVVLLLIARHLPPLTPARALLAGAVLACFAPVLRRCLELGQSTPLVALLLALFHLLYREGWRRAGGALLGLACLVKIPPLLLVGLLAVRRRLDAAAAAALVVALGVGVSLLAFGPELVGQYAGRVIVDNLGESQAAFNNQSLDGAWMRVLTDRSLLDWDTFPRPASVAAADALTLLLLGALLWWRGGRALLWPPQAPHTLARARDGFELELALGTALMLLVFPVVWIHYYLFLAVPLAVLPHWWLDRRVPLGVSTALLVAAGLWLCASGDVPGNPYYGRHQHERAFRLAQNARPLGALLLLVGLSAPLAALAGRSPQGVEE